MTRVYLLLGSNVVAEKNLPAAVKLLREHGLVAVSTAYETAPVGTDHPAPFLNAAAVIETELSPEQVKGEVCGGIERALGRVRDPRDKFAPRTIDVDIGLWGDPAAGVPPDPDLLEHPHAARPLADVAGDLTHPLDGRRVGVIADGLEQRLAPADRPRPRPDLDLSGDNLDSPASGERRMIRWIRAVAAAFVWAFILAGTVGVVDTAIQLAGDGLAEPAPPLGALGALISAFTLNGCFGAIIAALALGPLSIVMLRRDDGPVLGFATAVAAGLSVLLVVLVGGAIHDQPATLWWHEHLGTLWLPKLLVAAVATCLLAWGFRRPAARLLGGPTWRLYLPIVIVAAAILAWPDWRAMARHRQLAGLEAGVAPPGAPNLVLICIDTLRRDKLSCLDDGAPETPRLDALAARGQLFSNAWSVSSWTVPAMSTVMTGLPPRSLGVSETIGLPGGVATLAEVAYEAGWSTAAAVANPYLIDAFGFNRGFAHFDHTDVIEALLPAATSTLAREITRYVLGATEPIDGRRLVQSVVTWLPDRPADRPFFLWVHFMDPHVPYRLHPDDPGPRVDLPAHPLLSADRFMSLDALRAQLPDVPAAVRAAVAALYDGEVRHADRCVGELLDALEAAGVADNSWIVVFADHGEEFFEHGGFEHGHSLLPEVTGVPLIIRPPGGLDGGLRDQRAVSLLDLVPSLCAALGWPAPDALPGRACLIPDAAGRLATPTPLTVLENMLYGPPQQATLRWPDLRVVDLASGRGAWYQLATDPGALVRAPAPSDSSALREARRALLAAWDDLARELETLGRDEAPLSEAERRRLRSLGY